jgi:putative spermidine/putrescine transport system ATP-binding protein
VELKGLQRRLGITFVYVTHDQGEALSMSDRVAVFDRGRIEQLAAPQELYLRPRTAFVARFVGSSNVFEGALAERLAGSPAPFAVRPERIGVQAPAAAVPEGHVGCEGTLLDVQFHGATSRWQVEVDGRVVAAEPRDAAPQAPGTRVRLLWARAAMAPLEAGAA